MRQLPIHRSRNGMETLPSLTITSSGRARRGNSHTSHGMDSVGGDVVDLTTDSGVEDDDVVDITNQVGMFPCGDDHMIKRVGFFSLAFCLWSFRTVFLICWLSACAPSCHW